ncbi:hypothetical protein Pst134EB_006258 [Puccinia striiformis f. sp. tritici]|nr:hypothetical protein Pst134EB_006258 [Puccinia striiformis f. sp. tritici]
MNTYRCSPLKSVPNGNRTNQYSNVNTPSCISCAGFGGSTPENFELNLTTNTALNNVFQSGSTYFLDSSLLTMDAHQHSLTSTIPPFVMVLLARPLPTSPKKSTSSA